MEIWKPIPSLPGHYLASNLGRIKSVKFKTDKIIKGSINNHGYIRTSLVVQEKSKGFSTHRLIAEAFFGPSTLQVNHKDGNKTNNAIENLEYVTGQQNRRHAMEVLDSYKRGEKHPRSKYTDSDIRKIRELLATGMRQADIATIFGCDQTNISNIALRKTWGHVS